MQLYILFRYQLILFILFCFCYYFCNVEILSIMKLKVGFVFLIVLFLLNGKLYSFEFDANDDSSDEYGEAIDSLSNESNNYYGLIQIYADSLVNFVLDYQYKLKPGLLNDSIFCSKILQHIAEVKVLVEKENLNQKSIISESEHQVEKLMSERYRVTRNLLIIVSIMSIVLLILSYSRYRIIVKSKKILEEKQIEISKVNMNLVEKNTKLSEHEQKLELLNKELNEANQNLLKSEKKLMAINSSKDKFFSIISHDLRNPFASISSFSRIIKRDIKSMSQQELIELVGEMDASILKINNLLDNLLMWSRSQSGKNIFFPQSINLLEVINDNIELFSASAKEKGVSLNSEVNKDISVYADKNMLDTIIRNLVSNSVKYSKADGIVSITAVQNEKYAVISIIDNGVGISDEDKMKLFNSDLFHSTYGTNEEKGSGLGLKICKEFVEKLGGEITFESQQGVGSEFTFTVPLVSQ